jgi:hypothetical protein
MSPAPASPPGLHGVPSGEVVPGVQTWLVLLHVPAPVHGLVEAQSRVGSVETQTNLHSESQPSAAVPFLLPSSHSSGGVT